MTSTTLPRSELTPQLSGWRGGSGPDLILIHGVGLNADAWGPMLPILTRHFSVTAIDLPGHGDSAPAADRSTLRDFSTTISELFAADGSKSLVMGHSLGALIALDLAIAYPDRIAATVQLNAIFRRSPAARTAVRKRAAELLNAEKPNPGPTLMRWFGDSPRGELADMAGDCHRWLTDVDPKAYQCAYTLFAEQDGPSDADLANLVGPTLFVTGSEEPNSTPEMSIAMAALAPRGRAVVIDGARHMMPMTHAAEVCAHLLEFCKHLDGIHDPV
ncbi:MAG: alpha/beta fold hydrolase [Rhizobiaceae bacterium]